MAQSFCAAGYDGLAVVSRREDDGLRWDRCDARVHVTTAIAGTDLFLDRYTVDGECEALQGMDVLHASLRPCDLARESGVGPDRGGGSEVGPTPRSLTRARLSHARSG